MATSLKRVKVGDADVVVHETLEGSLTATSSIGRGFSGSGRSRSRDNSGLAQLLSEGKSIGEALAEKAEKEQRRSGV